MYEWEFSFSSSVICTDMYVENEFIPGLNPNLGIHILEKKLLYTSVR